MTLISSIILDAFRESNMLPLGKDPTEKQGTEALRLYNALLAAIYGGDAGERLEDWPLGNFGRNTAEEPTVWYSDGVLRHPSINRRLVAVNEVPLTVSFTVYPQDGARMGISDPFSRLAAYPITLDGSGRPIEGAASIVLDTNGLFREWIYRADLAAWLRVNNVEADDENPFPANFDMMFIILLAMRLNPRYGRTLDDQSVAMLKKNKQEFVARYLQSQPLEADDSISWPFMSIQGNGWRGYSSTSAFNRGSYRDGR